MTSLVAVKKGVETLKKAVYVGERKLVVITWANGQEIARLWSDGSLVVEGEV